ncbi:putative F-box domain-containing protein [Tanacetum coccineum]
MVVFDVVECILLRSAATDLTSWKVVCKSWYSLISSPRFAQAHLNHTCSNNELGHVRIAMPSYWKIPNEKRLYESNLWKIVGSSNGVVCISPIQGDPLIMVSNPCTRELRKLPMAPLVSQKYMSGLCFSFGYDSPTDDYKVVLVISKSDDHAVLVQVLSMKSNTWKLIGLFNYGFINDIPGIVDDRLCLFFSKTRSNLPPDIWVMRNYNVEQSWELLPPNDYEMKHEVVHHMKMIEYALPKNKRMSFFCDDNKCLSRAWKDVIAYIFAYRFVPSLVSPYAGRPSHAKNNKTGFKACSVKAMGKRIIVKAYEQKTRKIEEIYRRQVGDTDNLYFHNHGNGEIEEIVTKIEGITLFAERGRGREE